MQFCNYLRQYWLIILNHHSFFNKTLLTKEKMAYLCRYEKKNDLDNSCNHGIFLHGVALPSAEIHPGDGGHEEGTVR